MDLSLSVRVAESFNNKRVTNIALTDLAKIAEHSGFQNLCMRASMVGIHSPTGQAHKVRKVLNEHGLNVSMVTGDFAIPENGVDGPESLQKITPHLNLAETLHCDLIRICMKTEEDIPIAQRAADEARERSIRLAHQSHTCSLFETVDGSLDILKKVNRPNFGLIYEPANLALCGEDYGAETLKIFAPYLFNVYLQNHVPDKNGSKPMQTWTQGNIMSTLFPSLDTQGGIDFKEVFSGLNAINYDGFVTLHHAFGENLPPKEAALQSSRFFQKYRKMEYKM